MIMSLVVAATVLSAWILVMLLIVGSRMNRAHILLQSSLEPQEQRGARADG